MIPFSLGKKLGGGLVQGGGSDGEGVTICRITALPCGRSCKLHLSSVLKEITAQLQVEPMVGSEPLGTFRSAECPSPLGSQT